MQIIELLNNKIVQLSVINLLIKSLRIAYVTVIPVLFSYELLGNLAYNEALILGMSRLFAFGLGMRIKSREYDRNKTLFTSSLLVFIVVLFSVTIFFFMKSNLVLLIIAGVLYSNYATYLQYILIEKRYIEYASLSSLIIILLLILSITRHITSERLIISYVSVGTLGMIISLFQVRLAEISEVLIDLKYGFLYYLNNLGLYWLSMGDRIILATMFTREEVGKYVFVYTVSSVMMMVSGAFTDYYSIQIFNNESEVTSDKTFFRVIIGGAILFVLGEYFFHDYLVIRNEAFEVFSNPFILLVGIVCISMQYLFKKSQIYHIKNLSHLRMNSQMILAVLISIVCLLLAPLISIYFAFIATGLSYVIPYIINKSRV